MPTTRSATKQAQLDDFVNDDNKIPESKHGESQQIQNDELSARDHSSKAIKSTETSSISLKRGIRHVSGDDKQSHDPDSASGPSSSPSVAKKPKTNKKTTNGQHAKGGNDPQQQSLSTANINDLEQPIIINRSPVLQLWGATVAKFVHPDLSWEACLSIGNAISALCAVAKGQAIGRIKSKEKTNEERQQEADKRNERQSERNTRHISVMGFLMDLKKDTAMLGGKPKTLKESTLQQKFGDEPYQTVKKAMEAGLESWRDDPDELERKAFHMYEKFRPNVSRGQQGWGRKGELNPHEITAVVAKH